MLHTEIPDRAQVGRLLRHRGPGSVSIYVATDPASSGEAERIDFKNLAAEAVGALRRGGAGADDLGSVREEMDDLVDDDTFWRYQARSLADVADVARAATFGAVDTVMVDIDAAVPGSVDEATGEVTFGPKAASSYGVLDEIARRVWLNNGRVLAVRQDDVPGEQGVAAILRYAT
jgi:hypothetical protein